MGIWRRRHQRWQLSKIWKETCGSAHALRPHATHVQCARGQRKPLSEKELLAHGSSALEAENISKQRSHTSRPTPSGKMLEKLKFGWKMHGIGMSERCKLTLELRGVPCTEMLGANFT